MTRLIISLILLLGFFPGCHVLAPKAIQAALQAKPPLPRVIKKNKVFRTRAITKTEKAYDTDQNGYLGPGEKTLFRQRLAAEQAEAKMLKRMDIDHDGRVDAAEYEYYLEENAARQDVPGNDN